MKQNTKEQSIPLLALVFLGTFAISTITLQCLWNWFIVPIGVKELSFAHSSGLVIVILWLSKNTGELDYDLVVEYIIKCILVLILGFIVKSLM